MMYVKNFTSFCGINIFDMDIAKVIGENLKQARKNKCLTQKEVASKMLMTQQQYSRFENGVFELNYGQILFLCSLYEITPNEIYNIDGRFDEK